MTHIGQKFTFGPAGGIGGFFGSRKLTGDLLIMRCIALMVRLQCIYIDPELLLGLVPFGDIPQYQHMERLTGQINRGMEQLYLKRAAILSTHRRSTERLRDAILRWRSFAKAFRVVDE
jgi:hypothetical protein